MNLTATRKTSVAFSMAVIVQGLLLVLAAGNALAGQVSLPPVNLGQTTFEDGIAFPGWLVEETVSLYHATRSDDHQGNAKPGSNKITSISGLTHVAYLSKLRLLGAFYGAEVLLAVPYTDVDNQFGPNEDRVGVGDLTVSPINLQWVDRKLFGLPYFHRFVFDMVFPTGQYDSHRAVNAGSNVVSLNPYYAFTLVPAERFEVSARLHYLWNSVNHDPFVGLRFESVQPGQAFHANYAASYRLAEGLRFGAIGYVLQQLTPHKVNGSDQENSKERVFGMGPGLKLSRKTLSLYVNGYFETGAENRTEGAQIMVRFSSVF